MSVRRNSPQNETERERERKSRQQALYSARGFSKCIKREKVGHVVVARRASLTPHRMYTIPTLRVIQIEHLVRVVADENNQRCFCTCSCVIEFHILVKLHISEPSTYTYIFSLRRFGPK